MSGTAAVNKDLRLFIFERDGWSCQFCGEAERGWLTVDHIIPLKHGGSSDASNLWTLCRWCNSIKGTRLMPFQLGLKFRPRRPYRACYLCGSLDHPTSLHVYEDSFNYARAMRRATV